jgi:hypothetical protein
MLHQNLVNIASDADLRHSVERNNPKMLDDYFVTKNGDIVTDADLFRFNALNYYLYKGLDAVSTAISRL